MQAASSSIWTSVAVFIFKYDKYYTTATPLQACMCVFLKKLIFVFIAVNSDLNISFM